MTRSLIAGDTHCNGGWTKVLVREARKAECTTILQLGDFGFWEPRGDGRVFLDDLSRNLGADLTLLWIDGNHEQHEYLRATYHPEIGKFCEIRPNIFHIPRGTRWESDGITYLGLGGAFSIDKSSRQQGVSWFPEETITYAEANAATEGGHADVMLTHDCPLGVDPFGFETAGNKDLFPESYANRRLLTAVVEEVRPRQIFHGHYHHRHTSVLTYSDGTTCTVDGLGRDGDPKSWLIFDAKHDVSSDGV